MASGKTHDIINLAAFPAFVYYLKPDNFIGFFTGYIVGTFFLSPDNDIFHSKPNRRWKFLRFIWKPYTIIFSHRGLSHIPVIGMLLKLIYLLSVFLLFFSVIAVFSLLIQHITGYKMSTLYNLNINKDSLKAVLINPFTVSFFIGLFLSEVVHIITDIIYSKTKKLIKSL